MNCLATRPGPMSGQQHQACCGWRRPRPPTGSVSKNRQCHGSIGGVSDIRGRCVSRRTCDRQDRNGDCDVSRMADAHVDPIRNGLMTTHRDDREVDRPDDGQSLLVWARSSDSGEGLDHGLLQAPMTRVRLGRTALGITVRPLIGGEQDVQIDVRLDPPIDLFDVHADADRPAGTLDASRQATGREANSRKWVSNASCGSASSCNTNSTSVR